MKFGIFLGAIIGSVFGVCIYAIIELFKFTANYFEVSGWVVFGAFCVLNMLFSGPVISRTVIKERF